MGAPQWASEYRGVTSGSTTIYRINNNIQYQNIQNYFKLNKKTLMESTD
jgi:hypothetical protein